MRQGRQSTVCISGTSIMETTTLCAVVAALTVLPNRSQFFQYGSITLSCEQEGNWSEWRIKRNTSTNTNEDCQTQWNSTNGAKCSIPDLYPSDSGIYWCASETGGCSNTINITVSAGSVILESPALPLMEGEAVTLRCVNGITSSFNLTTNFYKNELFMGRSSTGVLTIHSVSKSDEGSYNCNISGVGQSPDGWLRIQAGHTAKNFPLVYILLPVVGVCLSLVLVLLLWLWRSHKAKTDPDISYTDVTITQDAQPRRTREDNAVDAVATFYSTLKLEAT
ncbi:low affinity immunoglobulin gamma Fc region receptor II-like [Channa argus]|uniref:low affinity immunoglobulin gamma Fc region receptor II-like n=1 Tax=Channa argus TaxID=215402 RepID=UPI0035210D12